MLSVCFRMKVIIALLQLLQWMIAEAKKETFPERNGKKKLEKYIGPAIKVTLYHAPTTDRSSNTLWEKKFLHGSMGERESENCSSRSLWHEQLPWRGLVPAFCKWEIRRTGKLVTTGEIFQMGRTCWVICPSPCLGRIIYISPKKIAQNNFTRAEEWSKGHNRSLPSLTSASQEVQPAAAVGWLWAQTLQVLSERKFWGGILP